MSTTDQTPGKLTPGTPVVLSGLQKHQAMNGRPGYVTKWNPSAGRYVICVDSVLSVAVRPKHITVTSDTSGVHAAVTELLVKLQRHV